MGDQILSASDLGTYLSAPVDQDRADQILWLAQTLCESVVSPLPDGAEAVILDVASRAWSNPGNAQSQTTGPYSTSFGSVSGGLWLTRQNKATLRRLSGGGGAFTVDTVPVGAGTQLPWWDSGAVPYYGDFDEPLS